MRRAALGGIIAGIGAACAASVMTTVPLHAGVTDAAAHAAAPHNIPRADTTVVPASADVNRAPAQDRPKKVDVVVSQADEPDPAKDDSLTGGTWVAQDIRGGGVIDNAQSSIKFAEGGRVSGSGACNRFMGAATRDGDKLTFAELAGTRMACPPALMDQERKFLTALEATSSFQIDGSFLRLLDDKGVELVRFTRQP